MDRNLLFISKYPEIIEEFTREMRDKEIDIDIADNGIDAAILLRKKEYQVVITGISLDGFNGEQIVTYVNRTYPDTVCILYTTTISAPQLHFFLNERDVYKVFIRPVNFRQEFFQALEEAFLYHDIKKKNHEEKEAQKKRLSGNKEAVEELKETLERQQNGWFMLEEFGKKVVAYTTDNQAEKGLREVEMQIVQKGCRNHDMAQLERLKAGIEEL